MKSAAIKAGRSDKAVMKFGWILVLEQNPR
jgi:hypothetical protein